MELLISIAIFAILVAGFYSVFWVGIRAHINEEKETRSYQNVRLALNKIAIDFQNALYTSNLGLGGKASSLYFFTIPERGEMPVQIQYRAKKDSLGWALLREEFNWHSSFESEEKSPKPLKSLEIAFPLVSVLFEYYKEIKEDTSGPSLFTGSVLNKKEKEYEWVKKWKSTDGLPLGIKVTLTLNDKSFTRFIASPLRYDTDEGSEIETVHQQEGGIR